MNYEEILQVCVGIGLVCWGVYELVKWLRKRMGSINLLAFSRGKTEPTLEEDSQAVLSILGRLKKRDKANVKAASLAYELLREMNEVPDEPK